jgi:hypothetical protein
MSQRTRYVGIDAHKATLSIAVAEEVGQPVDHGRIANEPEAVRKLVRGLGGAGTRLVVAYEAGPTGYALHRANAEACGNSR